MKQSADVLADNLQNTVGRHHCPKVLIGTGFYMSLTCTVTVEWECTAPSPSSTARTINTLWNPWFTYILAFVVARRHPTYLPVFERSLGDPRDIWISLITLWIKKDSLKRICMWNRGLSHKSSGLSGTHSSPKHRPQQQTEGYKQAPVWRPWMAASGTGHVRPPGHTQIQEMT